MKKSKIEQVVGQGIDHQKTFAERKPVAAESFGVGPEKAQHQSQGHGNNQKKGPTHSLFHELVVIHHVLECFSGNGQQGDRQAHPQGPMASCGDRKEGKHAHGNGKVCKGIQGGKILKTPACQCQKVDRQ